MALNQSVNGFLVSWKIVPAVTETWNRQLAQRYKCLDICHATWWPHRGQENPHGHRRSNRYWRHASSDEKRCSSSM